MNSNSTPRVGRLGDRERETVALLGAFCLFLATIEYLLPKPMPFMRLGIANLPLMIALDILSVQGVIVLALIKIVGQGLISGSLFSYVFLFSAAGTFSSVLIMLALRRGLGTRRIGFVGVGVLGALASNLAQVSMAGLFVFGKSALYIAPPFLAAGVITGFALGAFCQSFAGKSRWYRERIR